MFTKLGKTLPKLSMYILTCTMFGLAFWFNIYAVDSIEEDLTPLTSSPSHYSESAVDSVSDSNGSLTANDSNGSLAVDSVSGLNESSSSIDSKESSSMSTKDIQPYPITHPKHYEPLPIQRQKPLTGPALYLSYVDQITTELYPDIPADYVKAIIWRESTYNPNCVTGDNVGLMQISAKWDVDRAKELGVTDLLDPYGNILVGCDILDEFTKNYSFGYAINYHAGGYKYADRYKNSASPVEKQLAGIVQKIQSGDIVIGGE